MRWEYKCHMPHVTRTEEAAHRSPSPSYSSSVANLTKFHRVNGFRQHKFMYSSMLQKSKAGPLRLKSRPWEPLAPPGGSRSKSVSYPLWLPEGSFPVSQTPASTFKASKRRQTSHYTAPLRSAHSPYKGDTGPICITQNDLSTLSRLEA